MINQKEFARNDYNEFDREVVPLEHVQQAMQELDLSRDGIIQVDELTPLAIHILMTKRSGRKASPKPASTTTSNPYELLVQQQAELSELSQSIGRQEQEIKEIKELLKQLVERST